VFGSLKKSLALKRLSKVLGAKAGSSAAKPPKQDDALKSLGEMVSADNVVLAVLMAHHKTKDDLAPLYNELTSNGAAIFGKGSFCRRQHACLWTGARIHTFGDGR
jgi:hypothetical protein